MHPLTRPLQKFSNSLKEKHPWIDALCTYLPHINIYLVGGCVRDLGLIVASNKPEDVDIEVVFKTSKDIDLAIEGLNIDVLDIALDMLKRTGYITKWVYAGEHFPVYKIHYNNDVVDLALTRTELSTGEGHSDFEINFNAVSINDDLARRDFTINAMAYSLLNGQFIDPFNGWEDLSKRRVLKACSEQSFSEDPLRMLRAVQFLVRFDLWLDRSTHKQLVDNIVKITTVSKERIVIELLKVPRSKYRVAAMILESYGFNKLLFNSRVTGNYKRLNNATLARFLFVNAGNAIDTLLTYNLPKSVAAELKYINAAHLDELTKFHLVKLVVNNEEYRNDIELQKSHHIHLMPNYKTELFVKVKDLIDIGWPNHRITEMLMELAIARYDNAVNKLK